MPVVTATISPAAGGGAGNVTVSPAAGNVSATPGATGVTEQVTGNWLFFAAIAILALLLLIIVARDTWRKPKK